MQKWVPSERASIRFTGCRFIVWALHKGVAYGKCMECGIGMRETALPWHYKRNYFPAMSFFVKDHPKIDSAGSKSGSTCFASWTNWWSLCEEAGISMRVILWQINGLTAPVWWATGRGNAIEHHSHPSIRQPTPRLQGCYRRHCTLWVAFWQVGRSAVRSGVSCEMMCVMI